MVLKNIDNIRLEKIISHFDKMGIRIKVRDIGVAILSDYLEEEISFQLIYGNGDVKAYFNNEGVKSLKAYIKENFTGAHSVGDKTRKQKSDKDITFEENKQEIINLIKETQDALEHGTIEPKDALKIQADLRVKLNDKFSVKEEIQEQLVIVNNKFNAICECGKEIYVPTKEELIEKYNLVEKI